SLSVVAGGARGGPARTRGTRVGAVVPSPRSARRVGGACPAGGTGGGLVVCGRPDRPARGGRGAHGEVRGRDRTPAPPRGPGGAWCRDDRALRLLAARRGAGSVGRDLPVS